MYGVMHTGPLEDNLCPPSVNGIKCSGELKTLIEQSAQLSGTFKMQLRNATIRLVVSVCLSVYLHGRARLGFEEVRYIPHFVVLLTFVTPQTLLKIGQK